MSMYKTFKTDEKSEKEGIVIDYGTFRVTLARAGGANRNYKKLLEIAAKPHQRLIQLGSFSDEQADALLKRVYSKAVVKNWEVKIMDDGEMSHWEQGIESPDDGELLPFTTEVVLDVFNTLPDLYVDIREQAQKAALYRTALREEAEGNL